MVKSYSGLKLYFSALANAFTTFLHSSAPNPFKYLNIIFYDLRLWLSKSFPDTENLINERNINLVIFNKNIF